MSDLCNRLHQQCRELPRFGFPLDMQDIPPNGIYIMFEAGETGHDGNRIVRVGTHTGRDQLRSRMRRHFVTENKDRSIFRKHVGRALLTMDGDPFIEQWNPRLNTRAARMRYAGLVDFAKLGQVERRVTEYLQANLSFVCLRMDDRDLRLKWESKIIATVSTCDECGPSRDWLGLHSPKVKIRESGLWLINKLYGEPLSEEEFLELGELMER
jgi:hypothetical protein